MMTTKFGITREQVEYCFQQATQGSRFSQEYCVDRLLELFEQPAQPEQRADWSKWDNFVRDNVKAKRLDVITSMFCSLERTVVSPAAPPVPQAEPCSHPSLTGIDTSRDNPEKIYQCEVCGALVKELGKWAPVPLEEAFAAIRREASRAARLKALAEASQVVAEWLHHRPADIGNPEGIHAKLRALADSPVSGTVQNTEFCKYCGAGKGRFRRDGEGTCPKCDPKEKK